MPATSDVLLMRTRTDPEAFAAFYRMHETLVLAYFMRRLGDPELAADLTAETFAAALVAARRYVPGQAPAEAWLIGIARHKLYKSLAKAQVEHKARARLGMAALELEDDALDAIARLSGDDHASALLDALPLEQREAIRGRVLDEEAYAALAERLRCSEAVVRKRVSRGLLTLRRRLEGS